MVDDSIEFFNNVVVSNTSNGSYSGAALSTGSGTLSVVNNTIWNNSSSDSGGGLSIYITADGSTANIYNNIIYGNSAATNADDIFIDTTHSVTLNLYNNDFTEFCYGTTCDLSLLSFNVGNNLNTDPLFGDTASDDYTLQEGSLLIDAGLDSAPFAPTTDFSGHVRPDGDSIDVGAFEFDSPNASSTDTSTDTAESDEGSTEDSSTDGSGLESGTAGSSSADASSSGGCQLNTISSGHENANAILLLVCGAAMLWFFSRIHRVC